MTTPHEDGANDKAESVERHGGFPCTKADDTSATTTTTCQNKSPLSNGMNSSCGETDCSSSAENLDAIRALLEEIQGSNSPKMGKEDFNNQEHEPHNLLERLFLHGGGNGVGLHILSFLDAPSMSSLRRTKTLFRASLPPTRCMLTWIKQKPKALNVQTYHKTSRSQISCTIQFNVLASDDDYWTPKRLICKAISSGVDPNYRYSTRREMDGNEKQNFKVESPGKESSKELYYHYNAKRAEHLLLQNAGSMEGSLSSNDFILDYNGHQDAESVSIETLPALPWAVCMAPGWLTNIFHQPKLSRQQGMKRAGTILGREYYIPEKSDFDRELVLKTIRRLTSGFHEPSFQCASFSSVWRNRKGMITKRQQTVVVRFRTAQGRHPVELVFNVEILT